MLSLQKVMAYHTKKLFLLETLVLGVLLQLLQLILIANAENYYSEVEALTPSQRKALASLKISMTPVLPHDYMKEEIYLLRFLQFNNFNIPKSERQLKEALKWRQENKIDELISNPPEYFDALQKDYALYADGSDKEGRPICEIAFGKWPIRKAAIAGYLKNVTLHLQVNCVERSLVRMRELQAQGYNVTQWIAKYFAEQACPACLPILVNLAGGNDRYYPNSAYGFWNINTPPEFSTLFRIVRPVMSPGARAAIKMFSSDKSQWKPFLEKHVDFSEISDWYGGAKVRQQES